MAALVIMSILIIHSPQAQYTDTSETIIPLKMDISVVSVNWKNVRRKNSFPMLTNKPYLIKDFDRIKKRKWKRAKFIFH